MHNEPTANAQKYARVLRHETTDSERRLWSRLRMEQLGVKFRRQHPVGNYVADFACLGPRLIIELDGSQHADQTGYDAARDQYLRSMGFEVLRFPSNDPFKNMDGLLSVVIDRIAQLSQPPSQPSPGGGRSQHPPRSTP
ncbi:MAG: endonuclease domain-containing protein [Ramlibacter sp.]